MKTFEYKVENKLKLRDLGESQERDYLKSMGNDGWELVCVIDHGFGSAYHHYWKREKTGLTITKKE